MGILKTLTVLHKRQPNGNYSIVLHRTPVQDKRPCLLVEAGAMLELEPSRAELAPRAGGYSKVFDCYGCLGVVEMCEPAPGGQAAAGAAGSDEPTVLFLPVITGCVSVGKIQSSEIFCITDVVLLSLRNGPDDQLLVQGLKRFLTSGAFYFAHASQPPAGQPTVPAYDLTLAAQRAHLKAPTDRRFLWNRFLFNHFRRFNIDTRAWLVDIICGGINIATVYLGGLQAKACLISRLSCERAGTRFNVRGVNDLGHVANYVETEQVLFVGQTILSFLIVRGSIPLFWDQPGVQLGSHRIKMSRGLELSQAAYDKHMLMLRQRLDQVVFVNLLSQRDSEKPLSQLFNYHHKQSRVSADSGFVFVNYDYHALSPRSNPRDNLERLFAAELKRHCDRFGSFQARSAGSEPAVSLQRGVLRVNCLDCLDRTNSMQTFVGLKMLQAQLEACQDDRLTMGEGETRRKTMARLRDVYEQLWVKNGDQVSRIYAGTGALEGKNLLKDGTLSVARTIQNNLLDATKQCAIESFILGGSPQRWHAARAQALLPHYLLYSNRALLGALSRRYLDFTRPEPLKVVVASWNVNGGRHFDNIIYNRARPVSDWLVDYRESCEYFDGRDESPHRESCRPADKRPADLYAIGFQEIVDLNASNIVASSTQNQRDWGAEIQKCISQKAGQNFALVSSAQLVGVCLLVFARHQLAPNIQDVHIDQVKTGLGGATGNKGAVAIRLRYKASSICFVCSHFAAGQHQVRERNEDFNEIERRIQFPQARGVRSHDYIFWFGDFNYRISTSERLSNEDVRRLANQRDFAPLLEADQLRQSQAAGLAFRGYAEAEIRFPPTYKYDTHSNDYDTSEKFRVPAYTDRILFRKQLATRPDESPEQLNDLGQCRFYNRIELMSSDHRPVVAEYQIEALAVDFEARQTVLDEFLAECGPPDGKVLCPVSTDRPERESTESNGDVLLRAPPPLDKQATSVIFMKDGRSALRKRDETNGQLATPDWSAAIREQIAANRDNTTNLVSGEQPVVHFDDDQDPMVLELNQRLADELFDPDSINLTHELFRGQQANSHSETHGADQHQAGNPSEPPQQEPPAATFAWLAADPVVTPPPSKSPPPPSRPPPPSPAVARKPQQQLPESGSSVPQCQAEVCKSTDINFDDLAQSLAADEMLNQGDEEEEENSPPPPTMAPPEPPREAPAKPPPPIPSRSSN